LLNKISTRNYTSALTHPPRQWMLHTVYNVSQAPGATQLCAFLCYGFAMVWALCFPVLAITAWLSPCTKFRSFSFSSIVYLRLNTYQHVS